MTQTLCLSVFQAFCFGVARGDLYIISPLFHFVNNFFKLFLKITEVILSTQFVANNFRYKHNILIVHTYAQISKYQLNLHLKSS